MAGRERRAGGFAADTDGRRARSGGRVRPARAVAVVVRDRPPSSGIVRRDIGAIDDGAGRGTGSGPGPGRGLGPGVLFTEAGFEWREPGCSMCLAMNADRLEPGERCASTSNRNFEGRQGQGGRTHLVSPAMAAAAAIAGHFVDVRDF